MIRELFFEDYDIGARRSTLGRTITEADIVIHAGQSGDFYPHHVDAHWSSTKPFGQRVPHGTLVMSVAVGLTAAEINPRAISYGYARVRFVKPVLIGDTIRAEAEVVGKRDHARAPETHGVVDERVTVFNQTGEVVLSLVHLY